MIAHLYITYSPPFLAVLIVILCTTPWEEEGKKGLVSCCVSVCVVVVLQHVCVTSITIEIYHIREKKNREWSMWDGGGRGKRENSFTLAGGKRSPLFSPDQVIALHRTPPPFAPSLSSLFFVFTPVVLCTWPKKKR